MSVEHQTYQPNQSSILFVTAECFHKWTQIISDLIWILSDIIKNPGSSSSNAGPFTFPRILHASSLMMLQRLIRYPSFPSHLSGNILRSKFLPMGASRRFLHLAPPFLLDDYTPRYQLLSSVDASKKRSAAYAHLSKCNLCPRLCNVNRYEKTGACLIGAETVKVNVIAPHFGEGK